MGNFMNSGYLLKHLAHELYMERPIVSKQYRTTRRIERADGGLLCDLGFVTTGCIHDAQGGCVMCNYDKGGNGYDWDTIVQSLLEKAKEIHMLRFEDFLLTPSGSFFDDRELSPQMRRDLLPVLNSVQTKRLIVESRADTITDERIQFLEDVLPKTEKYIEIGLESSNDWILKYCVNKGTDFQTFFDAVKVIHNHGMFVIANVGLGIPFMSERAAINDAEQTIRDALTAGADSIVLFPYHVRHGTVLEMLEQNNMYSCVSLWALIEVLARFTQEERYHIQISWYKDYFNEEQTGIYRSPHTCPACRSEVIKLLDEYRYIQSEQSISALLQFDCSCQIKWKRQIQEQVGTIDVQTVQQYYKQLAQLRPVDVSMLERELKEMWQEFDERKIIK